MAGTDPSFSSAEFRAAIGFAMRMGAPPEVSRRPRFVFPGGATTYTKDDVPVLDPRLDREGKPLDPDVKVTRVAGAEVTVDCAVEITKADAEEIPVGNFRPTKALVTLLDDAHSQVVGCRELVYNGDRYVFGYEPEALGMFDVGVFTMVFYAMGET